MHGETEHSQASRKLCTWVHLAFLAIAGWIYFSDRSEVLFIRLGADPTSAGDMSRRIVLFAFGVVTFGRVTFGLFYLLKRKFAWDETAGVLFALFVYQVLFALLGARETSPLGVVDLFAIVLFLYGSYLNTGSELQRKRFKDNPENKGKLFTQGLFKYARHINYFGDILWVTGWAILTRNPWSFLIPLVLGAGFIFGFIPPLTKHLRARYGEQFEEWEKSTRSFIPFIY